MKNAAKWGFFFLLLIDIFPQDLRCPPETRLPEQELNMQT